MSLRVCFVALHAYPAIDPALGRPVGGTETRAWEFARGLARQSDWNVSFVVRQESAPMRVEREGVRILGRTDRQYALYESVGRSIQRVPQFPYLKVRRWDPRLLWQLPWLAVCRLIERRPDPRKPDPFFLGIDAEIFLTFGVQANSARVVASGRATGRPVVLMIGSDGDLDERYVPGSTYVSPYGDQAEVCHWQISEADAVIVQTQSQQRMLRERFGREGIVVANPIDVSWWSKHAQAPPRSLTGGLDRYVLWVGRAEAIHKRPQLLIELAQHCPQVRFLMILNPRDPEVEQQIHRDAPGNVHIVQSLPYDEMPGVMSRAAMLVSTSALEGFPNVFLQAAACGVPVVSLRVGREFLDASRGGIWANDDLSLMQNAVTDLWENPSRVENLGESGREYVSQQHDLQAQVCRLSESLYAIVNADS